MDAVPPSSAEADLAATRFDRVVCIGSCADPGRPPGRQRVTGRTTRSAGSHVARSPRAQVLQLPKGTNIQDFVCLFLALVGTFGRGESDW